MTTILLPIALLLLFVAIVLLAFSLLPGGRGTAVRGMWERVIELTEQGDPRAARARLGIDEARSHMAR